MADRATLHLRKIDDFAAWAQSHGYIREPTKDPYEVLRLRRGRREPMIFYRKSTAKEHATCTGRGRSLVAQWIKERSARADVD